MGLIVGSNQYFIECNERRVKGCLYKTVALHDQAQTEKKARSVGWQYNERTGDWVCPVCTVVLYSL